MVRAYPTFGFVSCRVFYLKEFKECSSHFSGERVSITAIYVSSTFDGEPTNRTFLPIECSFILCLTTRADLRIFDCFCFFCCGESRVICPLSLEKAD